MVLVSSTVRRSHIQMFKQHAGSLASWSCGWWAARECQEHPLPVANGHANLSKDLPKVVGAALAHLEHRDEHRALREVLFDESLPVLAQVELVQQRKRREW